MMNEKQVVCHHSTCLSFIIHRSSFIISSMSEHEPVSVREAGGVDEEREFEKSLRPARLAEYIGQKKAPENLRVFVRAALNRREALDHVLLTGPPGLGKTTLSNIIANEMGAELRST